MIKSFSRAKILAISSVLCALLLTLAAPKLLPRGERAQLSGESLWVHDPSRIIECDGRFYVYYTGDNIPMRSSADGLNWENGPAVLDKVPDWMRQRVPLAKTNFVWAPDIVEVNGSYWLFYSYSTFGSPVSATGFVSSPTLDPKNSAYKWTDRGLVVATDGKQGANAIDPAPVFDERGELWMSYGSWNRGGIQLVHLDKTTGKPTGAPVSVAAGQSSGPEAPYIHFRGGWFYLFENEGLCCKGLNSTYRVMMGRSKSISGPYLDREGKDLAKGGGTVFMDSQGEFVGPGHIGILSKNGLDKVTFHFYGGRTNGVPTLGMRDLVWDAQGWPKAMADLPGGRYALINQASGLALGVHDRSFEDGAALDQFAWNGDSMQRWNIIPLGDGSYSVASMGTGKFVDVFQCSTQNGARINQQPWFNSDCQKWRIEAVGDGQYRLISKGGKTALSLPAGDKTPRAKMQASAWTGATGQKWILQPLP